MSRLEVHRNEAGLLGLRAEWTALVEADPRATVYQTWELNYYPWRIVRDAVEPRVLAVRDDAGRLLGVAPLGLETRRVGPFRIRRLGPLAPWQTAAFSVVLAPDAAEASLATINGAIRESADEWDELALQPVRADSWLLDRHGWLAPIRGAPVAPRQRAVARYVELSHAADSWHGLVSKKVGKNIGRQSRQLAREQGALSRVFRSAEELEAPCRALMELHALRWIRRGFDRTQFATAVGREEMMRLVGEMARLGRVRLHALQARGKTIAGLLVWEFRGRSWAYRIAFDAAYARYSPGTLVLAEAIRTAAALRHLEFDFGYGADAYKEHWATGERPMYTFERVRSRVKIALAEGWDRTTSRRVVRGALDTIKGRRP